MVARRHQDVEEQPLLAADAVVVECAGVVERLRTLHEGDPRVVEPSERRGQEVRERNVVAVEHGDHVGAAGRLRLLRLQQVEGVVDVAGLGVVVHGTAHVPRAEALAHLGDPRSITVVQNPGLVRGLERARGRDRRRDHLRRFVVGRDHHDDTEVADLLDPRGRWLRVDVPQGDGLQHQPRQRQSLEADQEPCHRAIAASGRQREADAPCQVGDERDHRSDAADVREPPRRRALRAWRAELFDPRRDARPLLDGVRSTLFHAGASASGGLR